MATVSVKRLSRLSINERLSILPQLYTLTVITGNKILYIICIRNCRSMFTER